MNIKKYLILGIALVSIILIISYKSPDDSEQIKVIYGDEFKVSLESEHIALLGCTPHPTKFLRKSGTLKNITLDSLLDIDYLKDSFDKTLRICCQNNINELVIAYLPVYFIEMKQISENKFLNQIRIFFKKIVPEIVKLIIQSLVDTKFPGKIRLIIPPDYQFNKLPDKVDVGERIRFLIKQFPRLINISDSRLQTITIINNHASDEDDKLIDYLKYEYLFERPVAYKKANIGKEKFHMYKDN